MRYPIEPAAQFIRRGDFVLANDVLRDECGVEYTEPAQAQYYALYKDHGDSKAINESLKSIAEMLGCQTCMELGEDSSRLTVVGEDDAITTLREIWRLALSDEYGYKDGLKKHLSHADVRSLEELRQWSDDYINGFFEGFAVGPDLGFFNVFSKHPRIIGILDGSRNSERYVKENK